MKWQRVRAGARVRSSKTSVRSRASRPRFGWGEALLALSLVSCAADAKRGAEASAGAPTQSGGTAGALTQSGGTAGAPTPSGGAAGAPTQGGAAGDTSLGGAAGALTQGGAAGEGGVEGCPPEAVGSTCFLCQDHWICGGDDTYRNVDPTPAVDGCHLSGLPGRHLLWRDGTITLDGVVVGRAAGAGARVDVSHSDGSLWLVCARAP
jgi:hypothetical protein